MRSRYEAPTEYHSRILNSGLWMGEPMSPFLNAGQSWKMFPEPWAISRFIHSSGDGARKRSLSGECREWRVVLKTSIAASGMRAGLRTGVSTSRKPPPMKNSLMALRNAIFLLSASLTSDSTAQVWVACWIEGKPSHGYSASMTLPSRLLVCALLLSVGLSAHGQATVAFLGANNKGGDPRQEYLSGIIQGILLYDLSAQKDVAVVDRAHLDDVLREQELRLSAVMDDQGKALQVGKLLGADWLLRVDYVFLGEEIQASAALTSVSTGKSTTFTERGSTENMIHALSERIILKLTGDSVTLRSPQRELSILSLQDETPGSIALYVGLIDAEVFMDGEFTGYSGQDTRTPFVIEDVSPGAHTLRIKLSRFGVVKLPEFTFHDWEQSVEVKPGKRLVVRANARQFNELIYDAMVIVDQDTAWKTLSETPTPRKIDASFTGRDGVKVPVFIDYTAVKKGDVVRLEGSLTCGDQKVPFTLESTVKDEEGRVKAGLVDLRYEIRRGYQTIGFWAARNDIWQNMDMGVGPED